MQLYLLAIKNISGISDDKNYFFFVMLMEPKKKKREENVFLFQLDINIFSHKLYNHHIYDCRKFQRVQTIRSYFLTNEMEQMGGKVFL